MALAWLLVASYLSFKSLTITECDPFFFAFFKNNTIGMWIFLSILLTLGISYSTYSTCLKRDNSSNKLKLVAKKFTNLLRDVILLN